MKLLFTADHHIKLGQKNVPINWQRNRYKELFNQLNSISCNLMVIGGDIFDRLPTVEELELYFELISDIKHTTLVFSGNHESVKKNTSFLSRLKKVTSTINPLVSIIDDFYTLENMDFIPYNKLRETWPKFTGDICLSHFRAEIPPHVKPEVDLDLFNRWKIVLAGDLHSHSNCQRNILYPGSPLTTSFHRNPVDSGIILIDTETLEWTFEKLKLPQLLKKTITDKSEAVATDYDHTIYEIEGNIGDLKNTSTDDLIAKKIVKRQYTSSLNLGKRLPIREELRMYLTEILNIPNVDEIVKEIDDYIKDTDME